MALLSFLTTLLLLNSATAFHRETAVDTQRPPTMTLTASPPPVTEAANLRCSHGSTVLFTTDCTLGTPVSYCYKPRPPIKCRPGYFPTVWHPDHCMEQSTCCPLDAVWITTECSNGALPLTTKTLFDGTLAGGSSTVVSCKPNADIPFSELKRSSPLTNVQLCHVLVHWINGIASPCSMETPS